MAADDRPRRGTRPANRRQLILDASIRLFANRGYEHVSVGDIAAEVEVGPSALYRHFEGKEQILTEVLGAVLRDFTAILESGAEPQSVLLSTAAFVLDHREVGLLWEREARHLPREEYASVLTQIRQVRTAFADAVAPDATDDGTSASAALSVVLSTCFHRTDLPRPAYETYVAELAHRALSQPLPAAERWHPVSTGLRRSSMRERLVVAAVELFAERTYASVGMEDLAASVGRATSSLYNHLPGKNELLVTALTRADGYLQVSLDQILRRSTDPRTAMGELIDTYARFAVESPALIDILVREVRNLPAGPATALRQDQRAYVDEWVHLLRQLTPDLTQSAARVAVHASLMMINDLARSPRTRARADATMSLSALVRRILGLDRG